MVTYLHKEQASEAENLIDVPYNSDCDAWESDPYMYVLSSWHLSLLSTVFKLKKWQKGLH